MECNNCGHKLDAKYIFCPKCGTKIDYDNVKSSEYDKFEDSPFKKVYEKKNRMYSIIIGILNFAVFALFFANWFGVGFFDLFEGFGFSFFDVFRMIVDFSYMSDGVIKALLEVPFYMVLLVLSIAVFYIIGAVKLFQSSIRIFIKKTKKSTEVGALWCSLISAISAYLALLVFENGLDKGLNVKDLTSNFIEVSGWFFLFIALIIGLLIATRKVLRNCEYDFTRKGKKAFDIVSVIYAVGIIIGFLVGIDVISMPQHLYKEAEEYEVIDWNSGVAYKEVVNYDEEESDNVPNTLYGEDFDFGDDDIYREMIEEAKKSQEREAEYEESTTSEVTYAYDGAYKLDRPAKNGLVSFSEAELNYDNYYSSSYEFVPCESDSWYVYDPVIEGRRFDFNVDQDNIDISDIIAAYPDVIPEGSYFYVENGNLYFYDGYYEGTMVFAPRDFLSQLGLEGETYRNVVKMFYKDYIDENGFLIIDASTSETHKELTLVLSCERDCLYSIIPDGVRSIGPYCYTDTSIGQIIVPDSCYKFDYLCFKDCDGLYAVVENKVNLYNEECFEGTEIQIEK